MVDWYEREREHIKKLASLRNIEIVKKNEPKRSYIPIKEYKAMKESSKYVLEAFKDNLRHIESMNGGFIQYMAKYSNAEQIIDKTIKSNSKYVKGLFGSKGSYNIQEDKMYQLTGTLLRQFLNDDYNIFTGKAEKLISSYDFYENRLMQNLDNNKDLFKKLNNLELENKRLKQIEKDYNLLKSEFKWAKDQVQKVTEEKYKTEIEQTKNELIKYKKMYNDIDLELSKFKNVFAEYNLSEVVKERKNKDKKNNINYKNKSMEIDM